jgi:hypothetical protein
MFSVVGGLMLVLVGLATWLFFRWQESIPPERKQITLFKLMFIALAVRLHSLNCCRDRSNFLELGHLGGWLGLLYFSLDSV